MNEEGKDRRRIDDTWREEVGRRMDDLAAQLAANTTVTKENSTMISAVKQNTDEIVAFFQAGKGFFVVVRSVGTLAKWIAYIAAASGLAWGVAKFGIAQIIADIKK